jgi:hypothetical protein
LPTAAPGDDSSVLPEQIRLRLKSNFLNRIKVIWGVQSLSKKYFCFSELQIRLYSSPSHPTEGRVMIVAYAG